MLVDCETIIVRALYRVSAHSMLSVMKDAITQFSCHKESPTCNIEWSLNPSIRYVSTYQVYK